MRALRASRLQPHDVRCLAADCIVGYTHLDRFTAGRAAATAALGQSVAYDAVGRLTQVSTSVGS